MQILLVCALISTSSAVKTHPAMNLEPVSFLAQAPQGVAGVMNQVEHRWLDFALQTSALDCEATHNAINCTTNQTKAYAFGNFTDSCHTVAKAIVKTTAGDRSRVQQYMSNVCSQDILKGKPEELCLDFSQYLVKEMSEYQHDNLEGSMDLVSVCTDFFNSGYLGRYAEQERKSRADEQAAREAEEQRQADLAAEANAKAESDAKAAVARQRLEAMQNATAEADAKREEAVRAAVEAQRKAEASEAAVDVQNRLKAEADAAENEAQAAKAKVAAIHNRHNATTANQTVEPTVEEKFQTQVQAKVEANTTTNKVEATENHNGTAKSFLALAPYTFS